MQNSSKGIGSRAAALLAAASLVTLASAGASAQQSTTRWQGWIGCWSSVAPAGVTAPSSSPLVCITPTADANVVDVATVANDSVLSTQRIDASGRERPMEAKGCVGTQQAQFSADGRRVYLKAVANCGGVQRTTSGILAVTSTGQWLDVQGVSAGDAERVRVARYRDAGLPSAVPLAVANALSDRSMATQSARMAIGADIGSAAVIEASRSASPAVVEAWLLERGQPFRLDGRELVALADAGVPARVTDAMVAVSNPGVFAVARNEQLERASTGRSRDDVDDVVGRRISVYMEPAYSPFGWGYAPYGYGYGYSAYGYGAYGSNAYGRYGYPGYYAPIIIVNPNQPSAQPRGQAVKGRGYTQGDAGTSAGAPASPRPSSSSTGASNSGTSNPGSSNAGSTSAPRSEPAPRTAHPRP